MPDASSIISFTASADTGARHAAAALVIQEAYRLHRYRQLVKVCAMPHMAMLESYKQKFKPLKQPSV